MTAIVFAFAVFAQEQQQDLHPQALAVLREAESIAKAHNIRVLEYKRDAIDWLGRLYAHGGYLQDAARVLGPKAKSDYFVLRARTVYGDFAGVERDLLAIPDPGTRGKCREGVADILWRMDQRENALSVLNAAQLDAAKMPEGPARTRLQSAIKMALKYLPGEPPSRISPKPETRGFRVNPALPMFPITTDGFRERTSEEATQKSAAERTSCRRFTDTCPLAMALA